MSASFVNKLVVDRDAGYSTQQYNVYILRYDGNMLAQKNLTKLIEIVYKNFEEISDNPTLNHTRLEIARLLSSPKGTCIFAVIKGQIVAYLIAEITVIDNLRQLMHIAYLFTTPVRRGNGISTSMLNFIQLCAQQQNISTLSLSFDTYNKTLEKFYINNHFVYDSNLRSYQRYDMMVKYI